MNIIELRAENIKKLKAIHIKPDGKSVLIGGENEAGKSSCLDAILYALAGKDVLCDEPLRKGTDKGFTKVNLGSLIVERRLTKGGGTSLVVTTADGTKQASPQTILDALLGILTFDPLAFSRMDPKKQRETLAKLVGIDFGPLTAEYDRVFGDRTIINREVDRLKALVQSRAETPGLPEQEVKMESALAKLDAAQKANQARATAYQEVEKFETAEESSKAYAAEMVRRVTEIRKQIDELESRLASTESAARNADLEAQQASKATRDALERAGLMPLVDEHPIKDELSKLHTTNAAIRSNIEARQKRKELDAAEAQSGAYTKHLDGILEKKRTLVEQAKFPLPGLAITDDAVLFEGLPLQQASSARQIKISAAIGMALNPKLRVMIIREGSLLDAKSLAALQDMANSNDFQLWIERVGTGKEISVVIEDGEVAENRL